jgi:HemY protein
MLRIANSLTKRNYLPPALGKARVFEALTQWVNSGKVNQDELQKQWTEFGEELYQDASWVKLFAQGFLIAGNSMMAKKVLDHVLDKAAEESLLRLYPQCSSHPLSTISNVSLIQKLEEWLKREPAHPSLHLALGQVCQHEQLWGKALYSLQQVLDSTRSSQKMLLVAHMGMRHIYEALEDSERNALHQKEALRLFSKLYKTD